MKHRSILVDGSGQEIAEAALVLPIVFLILLGIFWFGRAYNVYATITHAAQMGARVAASQSCASCGNTNYSTNAQPVVDAIGQSLRAASLDPSQAQTLHPPYCACGTSCTVPPCATPSAHFCVQFNVQLDGSSNANGSCGVAVSFQYPYQVNLPFFTLRQVNLKAQVLLKGEY